MIAEHTDPRAVIERQIAVMGELVEIGMEIARGARTCGPEREPAMVFARAARAVRLTVALQSRLLKDLADLDKADSLARISQASKTRHRAHRAIERAIDDANDDADEAEQLSEDAWERLTETDDTELLDGPLHAVVARICADLGLSAEVSGTVLAGLGPPGGRTAPPAAVPFMGGVAVRPAAQPRAPPPHSRTPPI